MENKKTILMLPSWWPKNGSINGSFFKEQAEALSQNFNFIILLTEERKIYFLIYFLRNIFHMNKIKIESNNQNPNLPEIILKFSTPKFYFLDTLLFKFNQRHKQITEGVGAIVPNTIIKTYRKVIKYIKSNNKFPKFDCIYGLPAQDKAVLCHIISTIYKTPYILAEHGPFPWPGSVISQQEHEAIENANLFLAISNDKIRQIMLQNIKIRPWYVGNLVDENVFNLSKEKHDIKTFIIVAANSFYKNYDMFINTMEYLKSISTTDFHIIIAGYGANKGYSKNAELLEKKVASSTISNITTMVPSISREEIPFLYNKADAFVMTSIQEGMPVSALEAAMSGLPIFSTKCGGVEDYIDDENGRIVEITDYKSLANYCNDFLNGKITFNSDVIRNKVLSRFGKKAFIENMTNAINSIVE